MKALNKITADFDNTINDNSEIVKNIRIENFNEFKKTGIPTSKEEFWKYTDPSVVNKSEFSLGIPSNIEDKAFDIIIVNGKLIQKNGKVQIADIQNGLEEHILKISDFNKTNNPFINLNNAFLAEGCVINFKANSKKEIKVLNIVDNETSEPIIHPRIIVKAGKNSNISILEEIRFLGKQKNLVNSVTNFYLEEGANVEHIIIDDFSEETYQISNVLVKQKKR